MKVITDNNFFNDFIKEFRIGIPTEFSDLSIYKEIENFKDAEYIYCIAYELLIRTDEYKQIIKEYDELIENTFSETIFEGYNKVQELIDRMNELGLKKTSFFGFDCGSDKDHVLKKVKFYDEIVNSSKNVRLLHKLKLNKSIHSENIFYLLIDFYNKKNKLYTFNTQDYIPLTITEEDLDKVKAFSSWENEEEWNAFRYILSNIYIPCKEKNGKDVIYKSLSSNEILLSELDTEFLLTLNEENTQDILIPSKSEYSKNNLAFWFKYSINDIKNGVEKLISFYLEKEMLYDHNLNILEISKEQISISDSDCYIPSVHCFNMDDNGMTKNIELDDNSDKILHEYQQFGYEFIIKTDGKKQEYFVKINNHLLLSLLESIFLKTLVYEDLSNSYINTEPVFSRPRLMFDEARLTNIPVNLNLSKEDLLLYISQIKDDYDNDKNIVKTDKEYLFDLTLESDLTQIPTYIKHAYEKRTREDRNKFKVKRHEFKEEFASAFYIYDLFKFFVRLFKVKRKCIRHKRELKIKKIKQVAEKEGTIINQTEITEAKERAQKELANYEINNLITQISYLFNDLSEDKVKYYLATMKEFIHGVNKKGEDCILKKKYNPEKKETPEPKYKNLIIGDSYIIKSNDQDLLKNLGITSKFNK